MSCWMFAYEIKKFASNSAKLLKLAYDERTLIICDIVYAELVPQFQKRSILDSTLATLNVALSFVDTDVAFLAGENGVFIENRGGKRERIISDFFIGAHAMIKAQRFLTCDRGFYKLYFLELQIVTL